jgi:hypothetical protein
MSDPRLDGALETISDLNRRMSQARRAVIALQSALGGMNPTTNEQFDKIINMLYVKDNK